MPRKAKEVTLTPEQSAKLQQWWALNRQLTEVKTSETALRQILVTDLFTADKFKGTESIAIGGGYKLKSTKVQNLKLENGNGETYKLLDAIYAVHPAIATTLVKWSPEISSKVYEELLKVIDNVPGCKELLAAALTIKPGMPQLEIVEPSAEGGEAE